MNDLDSTAAAVGRAVLVCQTCPYVWEPSKVGGAEFATLIRSGCPECGGWIWVGELVEPRPAR